MPLVSYKRMCIRGEGGKTCSGSVDEIVTLVLGHRRRTAANLREVLAFVRAEQRGPPARKFWVLLFLSSFGEEISVCILDMLVAIEASFIVLSSPWRFPIASMPSTRFYTFGSCVSSSV